MSSSTPLALPYLNKSFSCTHFLQIYFDCGRFGCAVFLLRRYGLYPVCHLYQFCVDHLLAYVWQKRTASCTSIPNTKLSIAQRYVMLYLLDMEHHDFMRLMLVKKMRMQKRMLCKQSKHRINNMWTPSARRLASNMSSVCTRLWSPVRPPAIMSLHYPLRLRLATK